MEAQENITCCYCHQPMDEGHPCTTLFCQHTLHTFCFFALINGTYDNDILLFRCPECHLRFTQEVPDEWMPNVGEHHEAEVATQQANAIEDLYDNNTEFKDYIKKIIKSSIESRKEQTILRKLSLVKRRELKEALDLAKNHMKDLIEMKREEVKQTQEFKSYNKAYLKHGRLIGGLRKKFGYSCWEVRNALRDKLGRRKTGHLYWGLGAAYMTKRMFRYRLRL